MIPWWGWLLTGTGAASALCALGAAFYALWSGFKLWLPSSKPWMRILHWSGRMVASPPPYREDAMAEVIRTWSGQFAGTIQPFDFKVSDNRGALYEPWTDGRCVGYRMTFSDGTAEYVYFNPSDMEGSPAGESACVFVYQGTTGDPAADDAVSHLSLLKDGEEWHGLKAHRPEPDLACDHQRGWWPCGGDPAKCTQPED